MKNWFVRASNCSKRLTSTTNHAFFCSACQWFIDHTHSIGKCWCDCPCSSSVLERVDKSQNNSAEIVLQYYATVATERAGYMYDIVLLRALVCTMISIHTCRCVLFLLVKLWLILYERNVQSVIGVFMLCYALLLLSISTCTRTCRFPVSISSQDHLCL